MVQLYTSILNLNLIQIKYRNVEKLIVLENGKIDKLSYKEIIDYSRNLRRTINMDIRLSPDELSFLIAK